MKKTVQIITVPLGKIGYNKNELCKKVGMVWEGDYTPIGTYVIAVKDIVSEKVKEYWQAQQLLVLSDDKIQEGDVKHSRNDEPFKKVIASYPHIDNTLPISKQTIQAWIDAGMPDSADIDMLYWCKNGDSLSGCEKQRFCHCHENLEIDGDGKGNILLQFSCKETNVTSELKNHLNSISLEQFRKEWQEVVNQCVESPTVDQYLNSETKTLPLTDGEIRDKANNYMMTEFPNSIDIGWGDGEDAYVAGYKKALIDNKLI